VVEDGFDGVLGTSPRPEPVTVGFKAGFPFRFERQFDQGLFRPVTQDGDAKRSSFVWITRFRDVDPADGRGRGTELEFVIMVIAVSCVKLLSAHNSTQHTSRKHKV
jgi:hypothetical protein